MSAPDHRPGWVALAPALFVLLWSSGFIGAKLGMPYAEPLTFLLIRFALVVAILLPAAWIARAPWPHDARQATHVAIAGLLVHAGYLGGVFSAIRLGAPAGIVALITGLQPVLTAALAGPFLGEHITRRQWAGFALGVAGVALVVSDKVAWPGSSWAGAGFSLLALVSMTCGTLYQKRFCGAMDLRSGGVIQFGASAIVLFPLATLTETMQVQWTPRFAFALGWLTLVLSLGAISLLYILIRRGEAARVSSLFYLTPPTTAIIAHFVFGENLGGPALAGMGLAAAAVALVIRR